MDDHLRLLFSILHLLNESLRLLQGSNISEAQIRSTVSLTGVNLSGHDMSGWDLSDLDFTSATLTGVKLSGAALPAALPSLPVIKDAVVTVLNDLAVDGNVRVKKHGNLVVLDIDFTAGGIDMQGGTIRASLPDLNLNQLGGISGCGQLFGYLALGTKGKVTGSGAGRELFGHVSGTGSINDTTIYGNVDVGNSAGQRTLADVVIGSDNTVLTLKIGGTDSSMHDTITLSHDTTLSGSLEVD